MEIKPSNIFYSHDTIMYRFRKHTRRGSIRAIGETLDDLCDGSCQVSHIPNIRITKKDGKWHTLDNRRLWVFHHYEAHLNTEGKSLTITADEVDYNPSQHDGRFTTRNGGISIDIEDGLSPWGKKRITPVTPRVEEKNNDSEPSFALTLETEEEEPQNTDDQIATVNATSNGVSSTGNGFTDDDGLLSADEAANTTDKILPTHTAAEITDGGERHEDQTRKRGLSENSTQSSEDCLEVKRIKTDYELNETL